MDLLFTAFRGTSLELLLQETGWQGLVLPNDKSKDAELLSREISSGKYHFIFSFGQKPNIRDKVYIETTARNAADAENIFLFGGSQGGLVSALAAEEAKDDVRGLLLLFPAMCIADNWNKRFPEEKDIPAVQELWGMNLGKKFFSTLRGFDVYQQIGGYGRSVRVIYGEDDPIVSLDYMERLKTVYKDMELYIFKGEGHGFSEEGNRRMAELTLEFVRQNSVKRTEG